MHEDTSCDSSGVQLRIMQRFHHNINSGIQYTVHDCLYLIALLFRHLHAANLIIHLWPKVTDLKCMHVNWQPAWHCMGTVIWCPWMQIAYNMVHAWIAPACAMATSFKPRNLICMNICFLVYSDSCFFISAISRICIQIATLTLGSI